MVQIVGVEEDFHLFVTKNAILKISMFMFV